MIIADYSKKVYIDQPFNKYVLSTHHPEAIFCAGVTKMNKKDCLPPGKLQSRGEARAAVRLQCAVRTLDKMKPKAVEAPKGTLQIGNSRELC